MLRRVRTSGRFGVVLGGAVAALLGGCGGEEVVIGPQGVGPIPGTAARFDLGADLASQAAFYDLPFPSDLRLTPEGTPDYTGFPHPDENLIETAMPVAMDRPGFAAVPAAYFRFDGDMPALDPETIHPATADADILLVNVDPASPARGTFFPTVASTPAPSTYAPEQLVAIAPVPGVVLLPETTYAVVLRRSLADASAKPLGVPQAIVEMASGLTPTGPGGEAVAALYAPMWEVLEEAGIAASEVAAATVFTTGDVVQETADLSEAVLAEHDVAITDLALDPDDGAAHPRFCEIHGTVTMPMFQQGTPVYDTGGEIVVEDGLPVVQGEVVVPVAITLPKTPMPAAGYPLVLYVHGSGGLSTQMVDRGAIIEPDGPETKGEGPAHVVAEHGFAAIGAAMPLNPERVPEAGSFDYINQNNLGSFPYVFRQGVYEQRLLLEAVATLAIDPTVVETCAGPILPAGATAYRFDTSRLVAMGQSMGGQYTNLLAAIEPSILAVAPTGAGGPWSVMLPTSQLYGGLVPLVAALLEIEEEEVTFLHPALSLLQTAWEPADAYVYVPRLARRPLAGHPVRSIYEPVGLGDLFFSTDVYDAMATAYGNQQVGEVVWPSMQQRLAVVGLDGLADYPVSDNRTSADGTPFTGVVVQYEGDGIADPHTIFSQLDAVKYQYGCFFASFVETGTAVVPAPAPLGTPCPAAP